MIRYPLILVLLVCTVYISSAQDDFIGRHKDEVTQIMSSARTDVHIDQSSKNTVYNLLKYVDRDGTQTILYVFDDTDICKFYKTIYDYTYLRQVEKDLNRKYLKAGSGIWYFGTGENQYLLTLKKEKWYFSVLVKKANK